jgi:hypothetical protein
MGIVLDFYIFPLCPEPKLNRSGLPLLSCLSQFIPPAPGFHWYFARLCGWLVSSDAESWQCHKAIRFAENFM